MPSYRAQWLLPIAGPRIHDGWVTVEGGRIAAVGQGATPGDATDLGPVAILPALVNAHTHLELSYLRGAVPPAERFLDWIRPLIASRRRLADPADPVIVEAARAAIAAARTSGTGLVGDVSNTLVSVPLLREAGLPGRVFFELLGFQERDPEARVHDACRRLREMRDGGGQLRLTVAPHAPYSVSPELFGAIRAEVDREPDGITSVHLAESEEELELVKRGTGGWRDLLESMDAWNGEWRPHGGTPVEYLEDLGFLDSRVLVVHGVQCTGDDLARLRGLGVTVVSCPRSNRWVGVGSPPLEAFYAMDVRVAFGTDSLASVDDLNVFAELAEARRIAPRVPATHLLESATLCGARALGFGEEYGTIEVGKRGALIAVRVPEDIDDVEEYLVTGITPEAVSWLDA